MFLRRARPAKDFRSLTSKWGRQDPRDELLNETSRVAEELRPRAIMVENVPGLAKKGRALFDGLLRCLAALGYLINYDVLQVADYGVPQTRRRLVILAGLGFRIEMPPRTHSREGADGLPRWRSLRDAIGHLEELSFLPRCGEERLSRSCELACGPSAFACEPCEIEARSPGGDVDGVAGSCAAALSPERLQGFHECLWPDDLGPAFGHDYRGMY